MARRKAADTRAYFLAGEGLPWYAIGGSIIAANISTEHFIGMIGVAYAVGFVVAQWEWGNWFTFSALIWIFLPYYIRGGLYTMPEFLERRYNSTCRYLFAVCSLVLWIIAQMAVVMLAGGKAMNGMFGIDETLTIVCLAVLAGSYTIYGGLKSVAWTDFLQFVVMMLGGLIVTVIGPHQGRRLARADAVRAREVQDHLSDHGQGIPVVRRLDACSSRSASGTTAPTSSSCSAAWAPAASGTRAWAWCSPGS